MRIGVLGTGYVGLVSGACLSDFGHTVICFDNDVDKIKKINEGSLPIYEPGLEKLVEENVNAGRLFFETDIKSHVDSMKVIFLAVGTPLSKEDSSADITNIFIALEEIVGLISEDQVIVIKSTVPVGTNKKVQEYLLQKTGISYNIVSNPEFLREGSAIEDFMKPDRVIIGANNSYSKDVISEVYKPLYLRDFPIVYTDPKSAEVIKYAANAFLQQRFRL